MAARKKAFCTIVIPDMETAAVMCAQLYPSASEILGDKDIRTSMYGGICGGERSYKALARKVEPKLESIWLDINEELESAGAAVDDSEPPWLKNSPPDDLGGHSVEYHGKEGVSVGCVDVSLAQLELIAKACKKGKTNA